MLTACLDAKCKSRLWWLSGKLKNKMTKHFPNNSWSAAYQFHITLLNSWGFWFLHYCVFSSFCWQLKNLAEIKRYFSAATLCHIYIRQSVHTHHSPLRRVLMKSVWRGEITVFVVVIVVLFYLLSFKQIARSGCTKPALRSKAKWL